MFYYAGNSATSWDIGNLSNWDTSQVTGMSSMFSFAGENATSWNIGSLSSWNTSKVTNMSNMFLSTGKSATSWSIGDLSSWDTSAVTKISSMFAWAGKDSSIFNSIGTFSIPSGCNATTLIFYSGEGTSKFTGNFMINGNITNYTNMLRDTATDPNARINLYYTNSESEAIVDELISLYGPSGTVSQGNIYKVES